MTTIYYLLNKINKTIALDAIDIILSNDKGFMSEEIPLMTTEAFLAKSPLVL